MFKDKLWMVCAFKIEPRKIFDLISVFYHIGLEEMHDSR